MASPTSVNDQITDSLTQPNIKVFGDQAGQKGNLFVAASQALADAAHNATHPQEQTSITAQAGTSDLPTPDIPHPPVHGSDAIDR
ncbi:RebB family R body protein [Sphingomonas sp. MMS12-HWE2-04]|uniref:RebB family R body protein n=1 Tax=Sphingomonas sp. MMS12-HWE2-04 TaxID=3234199 RepID=UPI00384B9E5C